MFRIMIAFADGRVDNAANHFNGVLHHYVTRDLAQKAMAFLKKDSPHFHFFVQGVL